ncbi:hypothetical protein CP973_16385 [Streptomyces albofaciens JCM 4342]|uniref:hypothetical protein n=1 Tax=Streptomyces albofaciens TaxID=66866 RepID=UPI001239C1DB|nr:hypothetical protein [Streptomyces albofaciens]KAA6223283.1 hypothetical protein CP973_16385 [Streptomyces albofaciens JCM 4342]
MAPNPSRGGAGRLRDRVQRSRAVRPSTLAVAVAVVTGVLWGGAAAQAAPQSPPLPPHTPQPCAPSDDEEEPPAPPRGGTAVGLLVVDNSSADSWLEVDRTLNTLLAGKGTAGSDHDGGGGAIDVRTRDATGPGADPARVGHPPWQTGDDE